MPVPSDTYTPTTSALRAAWIQERRMPSGARPSQIASYIAEFDRAIAEVAAKAWDEGFDVGYDRVLVERASQPGALDLRDNPYRARLSSGGEG